VPDTICKQRERIQKEETEKSTRKTKTKEAKHNALEHVRKA
jgi:hypothetical protein